MTITCATACRLARSQIVDLSPMSGATGKTKMAGEIRIALSNLRFMYVTGHGVRETLLDRALDAAAACFDLPQATKDAAHIRHSGQALHGYTPFFEENNDSKATRDFKEIFDLGRPARDGRVRPFFGPVPRPDELPEFKVVMAEYHSEMLRLAHSLMAAIALSLDLSENYFEPMLQEPIGIQRLLHYPPQQRRSDGELIGTGAHTDYGCLTILAQDSVGGLQVKHKDGHWIDAPPVPGAFTVNIGDMLQRLTNDRYLANVHRLINTSGREKIFDLVLL